MGECIDERQASGASDALAEAQPCNSESSPEGSSDRSSQSSSSEEDVVDSGDDLSDAELARRLAARILPAPSIPETAATASVSSVAAAAASVESRRTADATTNGTVDGAATRSVATPLAAAAAATVAVATVAVASTTFRAASTAAEDDKDVGNQAERVEIVDSESRCRAICNDLLNSDALAVDIEGVSLGRHGEICIVQAADRRRRVFLFDVTTLGKAAFTSGLKEVLESEAVTKLFFDCRGDTDALFHLHGVTPKNVLDMQVLCHKAKAGGSLFLLGFAKAISHVLPYAERQLVNGVKAAGQALFAPDRGGSFEIWKKRPLPAVLKRYCAQDVVHLFTMLSSWGSCLPIETLRAVSEERMRKRIFSKMPETGPQLARKDFAFPAEKSAIFRPPAVAVITKGTAASTAEAPPAKRLRHEA